MAVESNLTFHDHTLYYVNELEHLVYASSSSVYGSNKKVPYSTDDKVDNPVSLYAATKKSNELMAHAYSKLYKGWPFSSINPSSISALCNDLRFLD